MRRYFRGSSPATPTPPSSWSRKRARTWFSRAVEVGRSAPLGGDRRTCSAAAERQTQHEQKQAPVQQAEGLACLRGTQLRGERHRAEQFALDHQRRAFTLERGDYHHLFAVGTVDLHAPASSPPRDCLS